MTKEVKEVISEVKKYRFFNQFYRNHGYRSM